MRVDSKWLTLVVALGGCAATGYRASESSASSPGTDPAESPASSAPIARGTAGTSADPAFAPNAEAGRTPVVPAAVGASSCGSSEETLLAEIRPHYDRAVVAAAEGQYEQARAELEAALAIAGRCGHRCVELGALDDSAEALRSTEQGQRDACDECVLFERDAAGYWRYRPSELTRLYALAAYRLATLLTEMPLRDERDDVVAKLRFCDALQAWPSAGGELPGSLTPRAAKLRRQAAHHCAVEGGYRFRKPPFVPGLCRVPDAAHHAIIQEHHERSGGRD